MDKIKEFWKNSTMEKKILLITIGVILVIIIGASIMTYSNYRRDVKAREKLLSDIIKMVGDQKNEFENQMNTENSTTDTTTTEKEVGELTESEKANIISSYNNANTNYTSAQTALSRAKTNLTSSQSALNLAKTNLATIKAQIADIKAKYPSMDLTSYEKTLATIEASIKSIEATVAQRQAEVTAAEQKVAAAKTQLDYWSTQKISNGLE